MVFRDEFCADVTSLECGMASQSHEEAYVGAEANNLNYKIPYGWKLHFEVAKGKVTQISDTYYCENSEMKEMYKTKKN